MNHNEGQSPSIAESSRHIRQPEFQPLRWIHVIYDHSDDTSDLEDDLDSASPMHRATSPHAAVFAK